MLRFSKFVGTGNDFIFIDLMNKSLETMTSLSRDHLAQKICDRHFGVGADGVIFIEKNSASERLKWDFYNLDGSKAEFCGNAARCFGRWALLYLKRSDLFFESHIGEVKVLVRKHKNEESFVVQLHELNATPKEIDLKAPDLLAFREVLEKIKHVYLINSGVPHFVCMSKENLGLEEKLKIVGAFRFHQSAGLAGANVTFLFDGKTETFERGVEGFTLSCGTGVVAAAICIWKNQKITDISLHTPGGSLRVEIVQALNETIKKVNLIGPAEYICEGHFGAPAGSELETE